MRPNRVQALGGPSSTFASDLAMLVLTHAYHCAAMLQWSASQYATMLSPETRGLSSPGGVLITSGAEWRVHHHRCLNACSLKTTTTLPLFDHPSQTSKCGLPLPSCLFFPRLRQEAPELAMGMQKQRTVDRVCDEGERKGSTTAPALTA